MPQRRSSVASPSGDALAHVRAGEYGAARRVLDTALAGARPPWAAVALRARIAMREDAAAAIQVLARMRTCARTAAERAEADLLEGAAFARVGDAVSAESRFDRAEHGASAPAFACELRYHRAAAKWIARDLDGARALAPPLDAAHAGPSLVADIAILHGAIEGSAGRFARQGAILLEASARLVASGEENVPLRARIASQISFLGREIVDAELARVARREYDAIGWPASGDLDDMRFPMLRSIGWTHAIAGDYFTAFRVFKTAVAVAPGDAWRVMALADRAHLAVALDEPRFAEQEFDDARQIAERVRWETTRAEERFALLHLAELAAPREPSLALGYIARYHRDAVPMNRVHASFADRRVDAMENFSLGIVRAHLGERDEAVRLLTNAWQYYDSVGYAFRAGRSAVALMTQTSDAQWRRRAEAALATADRRWLLAPVVRGFATTAEPNGGGVASDRTERAAERSPHAGPTHTSLTEAQRVVYVMLLEGDDVEAIASKLGRSSNTVRNHIKAIYRTLGVRTRGELFARARTEA